eukprot:1888984-Amphidinium_carterae.1
MEAAVGENVEELQQWLDEDVLSSALFANDLADAKTFIKTASAKATEKSKRQAAVQTLTRSVCKAMNHKSVPASASTHAKRKNTGDDRATSQDVKKKPLQRWRPAILKGNVDIIKEILPPTVTCCIDAKNGRFQLCCLSSETRKSFSWTSRGRREAIVLSLEWAWKSHEQLTGKCCPWAHIWQESAATASK